MHETSQCDMNPDVSWFDTIRQYQAWPKFEGPKFKIKPDLKFQQAQFSPILAQ